MPIEPMDKKDAVQIARALATYAATRPRKFRVTRTASQRPLENFHSWVNGWPLVAADLVDVAI